MKIARIRYKKKIYWGKVCDGFITLLQGNPFPRIKLTNRKISLNKVTFLSCATPSKVILVGLNYKDHARELKMKVPRQPLIFLKPPTSIIGHEESIIYPASVKRLDYEAELAIVIGKKAKSVPVKQASRYIFGYTCLNDVTARDLQKRDVQWTRAKSFDTFAPLGPWIETRLNPLHLEIKLYLNGVLRQQSSTKNFIFSPYYLVSFISKIMTLFPGDVISTGTPPGVGRMRKRDKVKIEIEGIGTLANQVAS